MTRQEVPLTALASRGRRRRWWSPIQAGYNPHPFWKFEHLRRYHPVLMPICRRRYPVGADVSPPRDLDTLARWMAHWGLLPRGLQSATARPQLEALASTPVEQVDPAVTAAPRSGGRLRVPAEWEPSEAVIIAWPVLYPGLWDFYCDLVAAVAPVARVDVLIPDGIYALAILLYLGDSRPADKQLRFLVTATDDIWVRDYGPLTCVDE